MAWHLPGNMERVLTVLFDRFLNKAMGRLEVGELERFTVELEPMTDDVKCAFGIAFLE